MSEFVVKQNGVAKAGGPYPAAFYDKKTIKAMQAAGCKVYVDGKLYKEPKEGTAQRPD